MASAGSEWRILYSSTNGVDGSSRTIVSGALFLPQGKAPARGWPLIAWAHGTVGVADICAPSWAGRSLRDDLYLNAWLSAGFAIVATDYQGLGVVGPHPYLYTRPAAYAVLDSIRAVSGTRFRLSRSAILLGQSQGGTAVVATAGYAASYAPDVGIKATIATGAGSDRIKEGALPKRDPNAVTPMMGYLPLAILTAQQSDPTLRSDQILTDRASGLMAQGRRACFPALTSDAITAGLSLANGLQPGAGPRLQAINGPHMGYPTYALKAPLFIGSGFDDHDVPFVMHAALAREACAAGTVVEWHVYRGMDHSGAVNRSLVNSIPFARKIEAGQPIAPRCVADPE